jgi:hypothetical protein
MPLCFAEFHCDVDHEVVMLGEAYKRYSIRRYAQSSTKDMVSVLSLHPRWNLASHRYMMLLLWVSRSLVKLHPSGIRVISSTLKPDTGP